MKKAIYAMGLLLLLSGVVSAQTGNTHYGEEALENNTTGDYNSAFGYKALYNNTTGNCNNAHGTKALYCNTTGYDNTATGYRALYYNTTGKHNTAYGHCALYDNTTGYKNTAIGVYSLYNNTAGYYNTAVGFGAMYLNTTGYYNTATGYYALRSNTTGCRNTANGYYALYSNTTGTFNSAYGYYTLYCNSTGSYNTAVGYFSGPGAGYTDLSNSSALGYYAQTTASNQVRIGNVMVTSIGGQVSWTTLSDARFKQDVQQDVLGLAFIKRLRPVSYRVDIQAFNTFIGVNTDDEPAIASQATEYRTGFIAQEVEAAAREAGFDRFSGVDAPKNDRDYYGIRYSEFVVPLVKAVQELSEIVEQQQKQIDILLKKCDDQKIDAAPGSTGQNIDKAGVLPRVFSLEQSCPNPFNGMTSIEFGLPRGCDVELVVYNTVGQKVATLVSGFIAAGYHSVVWDATEVSAGTYFCKLRAGDFTANKKMLLVK